MRVPALMRTATVAVLSIGAMAAAGPNPWVGRYAGHLDGADGKLTIRALPSGGLSVDLWEHGKTCVGGLKEPVSSEDETTLIVRAQVRPGWDKCQLTIERRGQNLALKEDTCGDYHGGECDFAGMLGPIR